MDTRHVFPKPSLLGIVIRADGTVPFDEDCHPDVRAHIITHLMDEGHNLEGVAGTPHVKIKNWKPRTA